MDDESESIRRLVLNPQEALAVEIKSWLDIETDKGVGKLVKAIIALRNNNGGYLVLGFDDATMEPCISKDAETIRQELHIDKVQRIVTQYVSEIFEVKVYFVETENRIHPVIAVPTGVKTPIASKKELKDQNGGKVIINVGEIFVRTLNANNTASTARASWRDWNKLIEVCFDNREADIGKFISRHLSGASLEVLRDVLVGALPIEGEPTEVDSDSPVIRLLDAGNSRFEDAVKKRGVSLPDFGTWECAAKVSPVSTPTQTTDEFLNLLTSANPRLTGWPVWLGSRGASDKDSRPYVLNSAWEALIISLGSEWRHVEFMIKDPRGDFYLKRALQDDVTPSAYAPPPNTQLDFVLQVLRVTEAIAVAVAFGKGMSYESDDGIVQIAFRWSGLGGRELTAWANPERYLSDHRTAVQDEIITSTNLSLNVPQATYWQYTKEALSPVFALFDGFILSDRVYEDLASRLLERRL